MHIFYKNFIADESGVTAVEYALLAAAAASAFTIVGSSFYSTITETLNSILGESSGSGSGF